MRFSLLLASAALCVSCANRPPAPDWEVNAKGGLDRYVSAFMAGNARVEQAEFTRARSELASTGQPGLVARAELTRCALQVAVLDIQPCSGFEPLRGDAPAPERAYADYLAGRLAPADAALLPEQHRRIASGAGDAATLKAIGDPLARLVAAGVLFRGSRASPDAIGVAVDTASAQGWRRPLLAWLGVQAQRAETSGDAAAAARIRRRMALAGGES